MLSGFIRNLRAFNSAMATAEMPPSYPQQQGTRSHRELLSPQRCTAIVANPAAIVVRSTRDTMSKRPADAFSPKWIGCILRQMKGERDPYARCRERIEHNRGRGRKSMSHWKNLNHLVREDEPLAMHTWFQLGGPAEYFAEPQNAEELASLVRRCHEEGMPIRVLGRGSNVLIRDEGVPGLVVRLTSPDFCRIQVDGKQVTAGSGARLGRVVTSSVHAGLAGLEVLIAIPGTLGGALHGNASAHGGDIGQWVAAATVLTYEGEICERPRDELVFGYRHSSLDDLVILEARLELESDDPRELARRMQKLWILRKSTQPMGHQCAGRIFRDPRGASAAELVEAAGLKGTRIGGAVVSDRHANFIIAEPECTASDVLRLIDTIRDQVHSRLGVMLETDLEVW